MWLGACSTLRSRPGSAGQRGYSSARLVYESRARVDWLEAARGSSRQLVVSAQPAALRAQLLYIDRTSSPSTQRVTDTNSPSSTPSDPKHSAQPDCCTTNRTPPIHPQPRVGVALDELLVNLLGATLPDRKLVKIALLTFYGINHHTSSRIMARLQFHDQLRVSELSEPQLNALSALLSAPASAIRPSTPLLPYSASTPTPPTTTAGTSSNRGLIPRDPPPVTRDPISSLLLEEDLKRQMRANIAHHRQIGTLKGRQHAMGLPVRGQRNRTNGKTAKRLNRIERKYYSTAAAATTTTAGSGATTGSSGLMRDLMGLWSSQGRSTAWRM
ncbi:BQ2448_3969 [Microbotryum intermedium]|uniref:BQ2448_3969 protein n=1 Tax=Microbotryum intermedium TaxID=269621 RepID=A0A238FF39_9BASI|nr:BQ2448_3969 [Microbotryum intermedium]